MRFFFVVFVALFELLFGFEVKYSYIPKVVYQNQIFPVTIFVKDVQNPAITFDKTILAINKKPIKKVTNNGVFFTYYFKARDSNLKLPDFWISAEDGSLMLNGVKVPVNSLSSLDVPSNFSGVIASSLNILDYQMDKNLLKITLKATEGNLKDFKITNLRGKILSLSRNGATFEANYSFVLPRDSQLIFSYFNTIQNRFVNVKLDLNSNSQNVLKSVNLTPKDSSFKKLKQYTFSFLSLFFLVMFWIYKDKFYLMLFGITLVGVIIFFAPLKKVCVDNGAKIYILPIKNSTISKIVKTKGSYTVYSQYKNFYKIEYEDGVIGWVKNENICKD